MERDGRNQLKKGLNNLVNDKSKNGFQRDYPAASLTQQFWMMEKYKGSGPREAAGRWL